MSIFSGVNNPGLGFLQLTSTEIAAIQQLADLGDPNADRILFWDDSASSYAYLTAGSGLTITGTTITASGLAVSDADYGDVVVSGTGTVWTIDAGVVTLSKMANVATGTVFYRKTAGTGAPEVQTLATLKTDLGLTGTNSGDQTITLTGDITGSGTGSFATTLATVNSNIGSFGSATAAGTFTVNGKGLITAASNTTITPAVGSITGLGTGVATALAVNVGSAGAFVTFNGAGGTPSSLTLTNATGLPIAGLTASTSTALGVGSIELGHATDTTIARVSAGVVSVEGVTIDTISAANTLTNKRMQPRTASSTTASTLTPDLSSANVYFRTTQTASLTINAPTGTPVIGETIAIYVDSAGAQTLTMDATYVVFGSAFPASTTAGKTLMIVAQYNGTNWKTTWANAV